MFTNEPSYISIYSASASWQTVLNFNFDWHVSTAMVSRWNFPIKIHNIRYRGFVTITIIRLSPEEFNEFIPTKIYNWEAFIGNSIKTWRQTALFNYLKVRQKKLQLKRKRAYRFFRCYDPIKKLLNGLDRKIEKFQTQLILEASRLPQHLHQRKEGWRLDMQHFLLSSWIQNRN